MENLKELTNEELNSFIESNDLKIINEVSFAHRCESNGSTHFEAFGHYPTKYKVTEEQINQCKKLRELKIKEAMKKYSSDSNTLVFTNMGATFQPEKEGFIGNHRIRARFINNDGIVCFIEVGCQMDKNLMRVDHAIFNYLPNYKSLRERDATQKNNYKNLERSGSLNYTFKNLLSLINFHFNCSFEKIFIDEHSLLDCDKFASISKEVSS